VLALWCAGVTLPAQVAAPVTMSPSGATSGPLGAALDSLRAEVVSRHPALHALRSRLATARAHADAAGRRGPATLSTGLSEAPGSALDQGNLRVEVGREIGASSRLRAERASAEVEIREVDAELEAATSAIAPALLAALLETAGAHRMADRLAAEDALLDDAEEGLRARFAVGEARYVDVLRVRTERLRVQSERAELIAVEAAARAELFALLATDEEGGASRRTRAESLIARTTLAEWRSQLPSDAEARAIEPVVLDLRLADVAVARAEGLRALGVASRRTRAEAFVGIQRIGQANDGPTFGPSAGISWTLPRTASTANQRATLAEQLGIEASAQLRRATAAAVQSRLTAAREHYSAALRRIDVYDAALLSGAREERDGALEAYRAQRLTLLELLDFERALARAEIGAIGALVDAASAYASLRRGGSAVSEYSLPDLHDSSTLQER
jgi:cobalt-zinc-cadmium efflux system outer membrane protein